MNFTPEHLRLILLGIAAVILAAYWQRRAWRKSQDRDGTEP